MTELAVPLDALIIRQKASGDASAIRQVNEQAFGQPEEADLVEALRRRGAFTLSLAALLGDQVVDHILFRRSGSNQGTRGSRRSGLGLWLFCSPTRKSESGRDWSAPGSRRNSCW